MQKFTTLINRKTTIILISVTFLLSYILLFAEQSGRVGSTSTTSRGCGDCHGGRTDNVSMTVTSETGKFTVAPGSKTRFTIRLYHATLTTAGINIGVKTTITGETRAGTLAPVSSFLKLLGTQNELAHRDAVPMNNGYVDFVFDWTAPAQKGTYYLRACGSADVDDNIDNNLDDWNWMPVQNINVEDPPPSLTIVSPNGGETWCAGTQQSINWISENISNVKISLSTDGGLTFPTILASSIPASSGSWNWFIPSDFVGSPQCRIRISDASDTPIKDESALNFSIMDVTEIIDQPQSTEVCIGASAILSVNAKGYLLNYQWRKDNKIIPNTNSPSFIINNAALSDAGLYDVIITGSCGNPVTSALAELTVTAPPIITQHPAGDTLCEGGTVVFTIKASGEDLNYRWMVNGVNIPNANKDTLKFIGVSVIDAGQYIAIVSNSCGTSDTSLIAHLLVLAKPKISTHPISQNLIEGANAVLKVEAIGEMLNYQWRKNGNILQNAKTNELRLNAVTKVDEGSYDCIISNGCGKDTSQTAILTVESKGDNAVLTVMKTQISLDTALVGKTSALKFVALIQNTGKDELKVNEIIITGKDRNEFSISQGDAPFILQPGDSRDIQISFTPNTGGLRIAKIQFTSNAKINPEINLYGFGGILKLEHTNEIIFDSTKLFNINEKLLSIQNTGNIPAQLLTFDIIGTHYDMFSINTGSLPKIIQPNEILDFTVQFTPKAEGFADAELIIAAQDLEDTIKVKLAGSGINTSVFDYSTNEKVEIYPIPAATEATIKFKLDGINDYQVSIANVLGKTVYYFKNSYNINEEYILHWNLADNNGFKCPSGMYYVIIKTDKAVKTIPILIVE